MTSTSANNVATLGPLSTMTNEHARRTTPRGNSGFNWALNLSTIAAVALSWALIATAPPVDIDSTVSGIDDVAVRFQPLPLPEEKPAPPVVEPAAPVRKNPVVPEPVKKPKPPEPAKPKEETSPTTEAEPPKPEAPPRRVYGVRKIMAQGLGAGGDGPGLVSKLGNTIDGRMDDLVATESDLTGTLVATSSVDQAPVPVRRTKPEYSELMKEHRAEGTVTARLLIDVDGRVKDVEILSDFGHDSPEVARRAFLSFTFRPAIRDGEPVAVWITHKIRFEFEE